MRMFDHKMLIQLSTSHTYSLHLFASLQVIHQLKQLGTVWQDVLPVSIYCKAMGNLLNTAIAEVIAKIMMLEVCLFVITVSLLKLRIWLISVQMCYYYAQHLGKQAFLDDFLLIYISNVNGSRLYQL